VLVRRAALPLALIVAAVAWLGYYDYRAFGTPLTLPYTINRATYACRPTYMASQRPEPAYRHEAMRRFYEEPSSKSHREPVPFLAFSRPGEMACVILLFFTALPCFRR